ELPLFRGEKRINILIIADPTQTLPGVEEETEALTGLLDQYGEQLNAEVIGGKDADKFRILEILKGDVCYDFIHFTGHSDFNPDDKLKNGWRLAQGWLRPEEIGQIANPPKLVFSNSCSSARMSSSGIQAGNLGLGGSFLVAGVKHYIGTLWDIHDESGAVFAEYFYTQLLKGVSVGEALCHAKEQSMRSHAEHSFIWASYVHYGDPHDRPFCSAASEKGGVPADGENTADPQAVFFRIPYLLIIISILLLTGLLAVYIYPAWNRSEKPYNDLPLTLYTDAVSEYKAGQIQTARAAFEHLIGRADNPKGFGTAYLSRIYEEAGEREKADRLLEKSLRIRPEGIMGHILTGDRYWQKGLSEQAAKEYLYALEDPHALGWQAADAENALGVVSFLTGDMQKSEKYFDRALSRGDQKSSDALSNLGVVSYYRGDWEKAGNYFEKALEISPDDEIAEMFLQQISCISSAPPVPERESPLGLAAGPFLFSRGIVRRIGPDILFAESVIRAVAQKFPEWKCQAPAIYGPDYPSFRIRRLEGHQKLTDHLGASGYDIAVFGEYSISEHVLTLHLKIADIQSGKIYADKNFRAEANKKMKRIIRDIKETIFQAGLGELKNEALKSDKK
ncbi:MAG: CHAT domain-containing protein, partial [Desulfococcaceae bacterium]|nr:CHAT domain-containing protein [Desulfococcaceae bacterium]